MQDVSFVMHFDKLLLFENKIKTQKLISFFLNPYEVLPKPVWILLNLTENKISTKKRKGREARF